MPVDDWNPATPGEAFFFGVEAKPLSLEEAMRLAYERGKRPHVYDPYAITAPMSPAQYEQYKRDLRGR